MNVDLFLTIWKLKEKKKECGGAPLPPRTDQWCKEKNKVI